MNGESGMVGWKVRYLFHYKTSSHEHCQHVLTVNHALSNLLGFCLLTNGCYFIFIIYLAFDHSDFIIYAANLSKNQIYIISVLQSHQQFSVSDGTSSSPQILQATIG
jgi:hypothetical protein